jgi:capsular polysaccharide export protein
VKAIFPHASSAAAAPGASPAPLAVAAPLLRRLPHLPAFFPAHRLLPAEAAPPGSGRLVLDGHAPPGLPDAAGALLAAEAPWQAPRFGDRHAPVALVVAAHAEARGDPLRLALAGAPVVEQAAGRRVMAQLREARIGGAPGLPDPGPDGLGLPRAEAVLVLDPGRPGLAPAAGAMLRAAIAGAAGRPVLVALAPAAPEGARPVLPPLPGTRRLDGRLAPWTLVDLANEMHGLGQDTTELLALAAGVALRTAPDAPWAGRAGPEVFAALAAATRCADPFRGRPWQLEQALGQLAEWRRAEAEHRRIIACTGIEWFKLARLRAALAHHRGAPPCVMRGSTAIRRARRQGGAVGVWAATMPPGLPARCAAAGVPLVQMEDGFIRSAGLGVLLTPAASLVLDGTGMHFDAAAPGDLARILATAAFDPALLARAAALRQALTAAGVTKYNLQGALPRLDLPRDRPVVLVAGQVEDDAAMLRGGAAIRTNLDLLRAVRAAEPDACILFKPHPDVESGMRRGAVPAAAAGALADRVVSGVPIGPLYGQVQAVHSIASLAGFEALLRGLRVATWGRPFYAGWGLTEDHDPPPGRARRLSLDALVAAALILYPRYRDPVTGLPCPPEVLLERLAGARPAQRRPPMLPAALRALVARGSRGLAGWWAAR